MNHDRALTLREMTLMLDSHTHKAIEAHINLIGSYRIDCSGQRKGVQVVFAVDNDRRGAAMRLMWSSTRRSDLNSGWKGPNNTVRYKQVMYRCMFEKC